MIDVPFYIVFACIILIPIIAAVLIMCITTHDESRHMVMASFFKRFGVWAVCLFMASFQIQRDIKANNPTPTPSPTPVTQPDIVEDKRIANTEEVASEPIIPNQININPVEASIPTEVTDGMVTNAISFVTSYTIIQNSIKNSVKECMKTGEDVVSCERQAYSNVNMKYEYRDALHAKYKQQMAIIEASKK